jgi:type II secretory pathway component GspD/PulD (secretin)
MANHPVYCRQFQDTLAGGQEPKYSGEPISLNLKDVDLKDFFRLIRNQLNIIVDPNVAGNVWYDAAVRRADIA